MFAWRRPASPLGSRKRYRLSPSPLCPTQKAVASMPPSGRNHLPPPLLASRPSSTIYIHLINLSFARIPSQSAYRLGLRSPSLVWFTPPSISDPSSRSTPQCLRASRLEGLPCDPYVSYVNRGGTPRSANRRMVRVVPSAQVWPRLASDPVSILTLDSPPSRASQAISSHLVSSYRIAERNIVSMHARRNMVLHAYCIDVCTPFK